MRQHKPQGFWIKLQFIKTLPLWNQQSLELFEITRDIMPCTGGGENKNNPVKTFVIPGARRTKKKNFATCATTRGDNSKERARGKLTPPLERCSGTLVHCWIINFCGDYTTTPSYRALFLATLRKPPSGHEFFISLIFWGGNATGLRLERRDHLRFLDINHRIPWLGGYSAQGMLLLAATNECVFACNLIAGHLAGRYVHNKIWWHPFLWCLLNETRQRKVEAVSVVWYRKWCQL